MQYCLPEFIIFLHHHSSGHSFPQKSVQTGMAQRGIWQLRKLLVTYCDISGSSAGARCEIRLLARQQLDRYLSISGSAAERS